MIYNLSLKAYRLRNSITFLLFLFSINLQAQSVDGIVKKMMENIRANNFESLNTDPLYSPSNVVQTLKSLEAYYLDSLYTIRSKAYSTAAVVGRKTDNLPLRKQTVNRLLEGCKDKESGVVGVCSKALQSYNRTDFDSQARQQISALLTNPVAYLNNIAQLAGYIGEKTYEPLLQNHNNNPKTSKRDKFAVQLALARMGDEEVLNKLVNRIKNLPLSDDVIYEAGPALAYIRQKQGTDYMLDIIMSNDKNCESANPDSNTKILCAYRTLEFVAPVIKDFPLKVDASGDLDVDNYEDALKTARTWIIAHKENYEVLKDKF